MAALPDGAVTLLHPGQDKVREIDMKMKVTYADGREVVVLASARAKLLTEEHFNGIGDKNKLRATFYLAWASLNRAGQEPADFEAWVDLIEDVEDVDEEDVDPTPAAPPTGSSSS